MKRLLALLPLVIVAGCAMPSDPGPSGQGVTVQRIDPALTVLRTPTKIHGTLVEDGIDVRYQSEMVGKDVHVRVDMNGMVLTAKVGKENTVELDGVNLEDGEPTLITEVDRATVKRLIAALEAEIRPLVNVDHVKTKAEYNALVKKPTPAEVRLLDALGDLWAKWPTAMPLKRSVTAEQARSWRSNRQHAASGKTAMGCHDCDGDIWTWGDDCDWDNLDESRCCDSWALGSREDAAYGNCGTSNWGTKFTWDCTNHDQCVRTGHHGGHSLVSPYCDDQFTSCVDDFASAPSCNYDWRQNKSGSSWSYKADCPLSWKGTNDGCDCFCQFADPDCGSKSGITCDYSYYGTSNENNCPLSWNSTNDGCDCGCQFMDYDCYQ